MFNQIFQKKLGCKLCLLSLFSVAAVGGCSVAAETQIRPADASVGAAPQTNLSADRTSPAPNLTKNSPMKGRIEIKPNSPADAVRTFYAHLREHRFREAMMMTNLRPAVEGLTETEMQDFRGDFEPLARQVPADIQISGEIVVGDEASVTAKMPNEDTNQPEDKIFKLRRENNAWVFLTADEKTEALVKREGKNYFYTLRIDIHQTEAQAMLERVAKAQSLFAMKSGGVFADMQTLVGQGLLAEDIQSSASTGYNYKIVLSFDKKRYFATAEPAVYGKTGRLSLLVESDGADKKAHLKSKDNKGAPLRN